MVDHAEPARLAAEEPLAERAAEVELGDRADTPERQRREDREDENRAATQQRRLGTRYVVFVDPYAATTSSSDIVDVSAAMATST